MALSLPHLHIRELSVLTHQRRQCLPNLSLQSSPDVLVGPPDILFKSLSFFSAHSSCKMGNLQSCTEKIRCKKSAPVWVSSPSLLHLLFIDKVSDYQLSVPSSRTRSKNKKTKTGARLLCQPFWDDSLFVALFYCPSWNFMLPFGG